MYTIKVVRGNVVNATTEAIVCSANNNLMPGAGMNKMVFYAASDRLIEECSKIKYCETGKAVYTAGFGVPAKYIIHAVGPYWHGGYNNEARDLASCYISIMKTAELLNVKSIAIPSLCTGRGGYPLDEAIDIAVSSVTSYLQSHNLEMEIWFMCYDQENLLKYRMKNMDGVGDIEAYFNRSEIKINTKLNKNEASLLKKRLFKKEISPEKEKQAIESVLKRVIKKKYPDCVYLAPPKTKDKITMKTCNKHGCSGPFITTDCVEEFSYDKDRMKLRIKPFCFVDTPEEIESKRKYFVDTDGNGIPNEFESAARSSYKNYQKVIKVLNVESLLNGNNGEDGNTEYVDVNNPNVEIKDISETPNGTNVSEIIDKQEVVDNTDTKETFDVEEVNNESAGYELEIAHNKKTKRNKYKKTKADYRPNYKTY